MDRVSLTYTRAAFFLNSSEEGALLEEQERSEQQAGVGEAHRHQSSAALPHQQRAAGRIAASASSWSTVPLRRRSHPGCKPYTGLRARCQRLRQGLHCVPGATLQRPSRSSACAGWLWLPCEGVVACRPRVPEGVRRVSGSRTAHSAHARNTQQAAPLCLHPARRVLCVSAAALSCPPAKPCQLPDAPAGCAGISTELCVCTIHGL